MAEKKKARYTYADCIHSAKYRAECALKHLDKMEYWISQIGDNLDSIKSYHYTRPDNLEPLIPSLIDSAEQIEDKLRSVVKEFHTIKQLKKEYDYD